MKQIIYFLKKYFLVAVLVFVFVQYAAISIGSAIGPGPFEIGLVVTAIAMMSGIMVACTLAIIDEIRKLSKKD